jgi:glycosyltransferase involved in cell wall biosynthesis
MFLYISNATSYSTYNRLFSEGKIKSGYQMQKFNSCMIKGLSSIEETVAVSALPCVNANEARIDEVVDGVRYVSIKNTSGRLHKFFNVINLIKECRKIIKKEKPRFIFCDAIAVSPRIVTTILGKIYKIKTVGIVTDLPGMLSIEKTKPLKNIKSMQKFDNYVLLTEKMNAIVNPKNKPYIVIEGVCDSKLPKIYPKNKKKIILYTGALWKKDAGIEYLTEGFINSELVGYELHFYGTGELVDWIKEIEKNNSQVKYMGCVTNQEIVRLQTEATLLVNPRPSSEKFCEYSFPSKTIEYMLSGTPVLMTKLPGVPKEYFDFVLTIDNETPEGISNTLKNIDKNYDHLVDLGLKAREFVYNNKNPIKQANKIIEFISNLR